MYSGREIAAVPNSIFTCFRIQADVVLPRYLNYLFLGNLHGKWLKKFITVGARANGALNIDNKDLLSLPTPVPSGNKSLQEQQKIADCLTSIADRITAETQKLATLKAHKKGLTQQLFPAEGETLPKLRFPEFRDSGEWEETTIGGIGSFYYGKSAPKWSLSEDAPTRCVRYGELYTKFGAIISEIYSRTNIDPKNLRFSKGGEILVPRVGEKPEDFGKCCSYLPFANIAIGEMISVFETAQNPLFYTYYFRNLYRQFAKVVEGQNVKNLYYVELEPLLIYRPSLPEQQKIADCLTLIDEAIAAQTQKIATLKTHKKGLMQQLFPSI
jgi:restriction endonuclease S subunit